MTEDVFETPSSTPNFQTELAEQLAELVPEAVADGKIDVLKLQELLSQDAADTSERFGLFWPGKQQALRVAQMPTTATLRPEPEKSQAWETTKNVFIEGDNLEVLKILQKHYHGKIKMIYIDPPYNTGKDFVYADNFKDGLSNYLEWSNQVSGDGKELSTNSETQGRYHSNWLSMMYPRLKLARNLLTSDGSIFISIDDNEQDNLRKICNEIFGEENVSVMVWNKEAEGSSGSLKVVTTFRRVHEYILVCTKKSENVEWNRIQEALIGRENEFQTANLAVNLQNEKTDHENYFSITSPSGEMFTRQWKWGREEIDRLISEDLIYWGSDGRKQPRLVIPTDERRTTYLRSILNYGGTTTGRKDFERDMGEEIEFSYPKPLLLLKKLILAASSDEDIILDFFAGSGSTACAVMDANVDDGGSRKHIQVQLPEPLKENSQKFQTIADITRNRTVKHARNTLLLQEGMLGQLSSKLDSGFRSFRLADSGFAKWSAVSLGASEELEQQLFAIKESAEDSVNADELLIEILIKQGFSLTEPIQIFNVAGFDVHEVGEGLIFAYLDEQKKPSLEALRSVIDRGPEKLVILEDSFRGDDELKTNLAQLCRSKGVELWSA